MKGQRGQMMPFALGGVIAIIVFGFFAVNYANTLRWQVRAQNAADAAAQAILSLQTQEFNEMTAILYATAVEEYRIRHLLNAMTMAAHGQGGCLGANPPTASALSGTLGCATVEAELEGQYDAAIGRYTGDVLALNQVTSTMNFGNFNKDAIVLLGKIKACSASISVSSLGGDCAFNYGKPLIEPRTDVEAVYMDANGILKPSPGNQTALAAAVSTPSAPALNVGATSFFAPAQVEVYACATVPSLFPSFLGWTFPPFTAVARGAATPVMVEEDWLQPGTIDNAATSGIAFQPNENYLNGAVVTDASGYDWYNLDFGGNGVVAVAGAHLALTVTRDEFSVWLGWWNSIPIHAFSKTKSLAVMGCTT